jgi:hypothetical protein
LRALKKHYVGESFAGDAQGGSWRPEIAAGAQYGASLAHCRCHLAVGDISERLRTVNYAIAEASGAIREILHE